jgi:hypothetical protein
MTGLLTIPFGMFPLFGSSVAFSRSQAGAAASKVREEAADAKYGAMIAKVVESTNTQAETTNNELNALKEGIVAETTTKLEKLETDLNSGLAELGGKVDGDVKTAVDAVDAKVSVSDACAARGGNMAVVKGKCISITEALKTATCDVNALGATRYETTKKKLQVCMKGGPTVKKETDFAWEAIAVQDTRVGISEEYPATSGSAILTANPTATSGMYWIKPSGDSGAVQTYCGKLTPLRFLMYFFFFFSLPHPFELALLFLVGEARFAYMTLFMRFLCLDRPFRPYVTRHERIVQRVLLGILRTQLCHRVQLLQQTHDQYEQPKR